MVDSEQERQIVEEVLRRGLGLSDAQVELYFTDSPEGRAYKAELCKGHALDVDTILRERERTRLKSLRDYENEMAIVWDEGFAKGFAEGFAKGFAEGFAEGIEEVRAEERNRIIDNMRKNRFSEEQIRLVVEGACNGR